MNRIVVVAAAVAALSAFGLGQDAQDKEKALRRQVDRLQEQLINERTKLLQSVKVNDQALDPQAVMREAVYLTGGKLVEARVADFFILEEIKKQIESGGRRAEEFVVTEEDVMTELAPMQSDFETKNPGVDFWEVVRSQYGLNRETFLQQRKQAIMFDRVFFPGSPKNWPQITKEAIVANTQGDQGPQFLAQLEKATEGTDEKGNPKKLPEFWVNMMRQFVQKGLRNWSDIKYASHGLAADTVLSVNGIEWKTAEAFEFVKQGLFVQDLERAMQEVVVREALRQELAGKGVFVSDEEFLSRYEEYRKPYDSTPFTVEVIATRFKGYPCLEAFRARWRLITSYGDLIKNEINDDNLQAHADKFAAFFADGQVSIDVIPFQARNPKTGAWEPDGMQKSKARADEVFAALEKGSMTFDEALGSKGEFFANDEKKGRFGFLPLNQVKQQLRESEFTQLLDGYSVASFLFYEAEVGKTVGPILGPDGYLIARVNARTPARRKIDVKVERERELVREDFINYRFMEWANDVIGKAKVSSN